MLDEQARAIQTHLSYESYGPWDPVFWYVGDNGVVLIERDAYFRPLGVLPSAGRTLLGDGIEIYTPMWLWCLLLLAPTVWLWYREARRHSLAGCEHCGYDLRGNVSGRCPECGNPFNRAEKSQPRGQKDVHGR